MNFYSWIREGVRRAVLLGLSDAVAQLGAPDEEQGDINEHLQKILREAPQRPALAAAASAPLAIESTAASAVLDAEPAPRRGGVQPLGAKRKRLGRSLSQVVERPANEEE